MEEKRFDNPHLWLFLVAVIWGFNFSIVKAGVMELGPLSFSFTRFVLSGILMLVVLWRLEGSIGIERKHLPYFFLLGALGFGIYQPLWSIGLQLGLASHSAVILSLSPVVVTLLTFFRREEGIFWVNVVGIGVGFLGVTFLVRGGEGNPTAASYIMRGNLLTFIAAVCWGMYSYFGRKMVRIYSPLKTSTWSIIFGLVIMFPLALSEMRDLALSQFNSTVIFALFYGTVLSSLLSYIIWMNGVKKLGASRTLSYQYVIQVVGVVAAWLIFAEPLGWRVIVGMCFISLGLWLSQKRKPHFRSISI